MLFYIINAGLHCQLWIKSTLNYTANTILHHQRCILQSTLHYFTNDKLHHQRLNVALHLQCCAVLATLHHSANAASKNGVDASLNSIT